MIAWVIGFSLYAVFALVGIVLAALVAGPVGLFVFAIFAACMLWGLTDAYTSWTLRRKGRFRVAPSLRPE